MMNDVSNSNLNSSSCQPLFIKICQITCVLLTGDVRIKTHLCMLVEKLFLVGFLVLFKWSSALIFDNQMLQLSSKSDDILHFSNCTQIQSEINNELILLTSFVCVSSAGCIVFFCSTGLHCCPKTIKNTSMSHTNVSSIPWRRTQTL